jgi:acyl carrier protein
MLEQANEAVSWDRDELTAVIAKQLDCTVDRVRSDARLVDDLGADSLSLVQLALALEATFELEIPTRDVPTLLTVEDVRRYVERGRSPGKGRTT